MRFGNTILTTVILFMVLISPFLHNVPVVPLVMADDDSLIVSVQNVNGTYRSDAIVELYDASHIKIDQKVTDSAGYVYWTGLTRGQYYIKVYYPSPAAMGWTEYWGEDGIYVSGSTVFNFKRHTQWVLDILINGKKPYAEDVIVNPNAQVQITARVKNSDYNARKTYVVIYVDRDKSSPWDFYGESSIRSIPSQGSVDFILNYYPTETGTYYIYVVCWGDFETFCSVTDQWDWTKAFTVSVPQYSVTVDPNGGRVFVDGTPITSATTYTWAYGSTHTLDPYSGYEPSPGTRLIFSQWSDGSTADPRTITVTSSATYKALWTTQYKLTISVDPIGGGTTTPSPGQYWYNKGTSVTVTQSPNSGYVFDHWELDGGNAGSGTSISVTMNSPHNLKAIFRASVPQYSVTVDPNGGKVFVDGTPITSATTYTWAQGSIHTLDPDSGYQPTPGTRLIFDKWSDGNTADPRTITVTSSAVYRVFWIIQYSLAVSIEPANAGTTNPQPGTYWYNAGSSVVVSESPNSGYYFDRWELDGINLGSGTTVTVTMNAPHNLKAIFKETDFSVTVSFSSVEINRGKNVQVTVTVTEIGSYDFLVSLTATGQPTGVTITFSPISGIPTFSSIMTIQVADYVPLQIYTVTIQGLGADGKQRSTILQINVKPQDAYSYWNTNGDFELTAFDSGTIYDTTYRGAPWGSKSWGVHSYSWVYGGESEYPLHASRFLSDGHSAYLFAHETAGRIGLAKYVQGDVWSINPPWYRPLPLLIRNKRIMLTIDIYRDTNVGEKPGSDRIKFAVNVWLKSQELNKPLVLDLIFYLGEGDTSQSGVDQYAYHYAYFVGETPYREWKKWTIDLWSIVTNALDFFGIEGAHDTLYVYQLEFHVEVIYAKAAATIDNFYCYYDPVPELPLFKGMTVVAWSSNAYGTTLCKESLQNLKSTGANWVVFTQFYFMDTKTSNYVYPRYDKYTSYDEALGQAIYTAKSLGFKVALKPMIDVLDGTWRAEIQPSDRSQWYLSYMNYINKYAEFASAYNVDLFVIGTELNSMQIDTLEWTRIINDVRLRYNGLITYAANWDNYYVNQVKFWYALDFIGVDAYFPLTNSATTTVDTLVNAWYYSTAENYEGRNWVNELAATANYLGKLVIFTEIGYLSCDGTNTRPYDPNLPKEFDEIEQAHCYEAALKVFREQVWFQGWFWWMWETRPDAGGENDCGYTPQNKEAEEILHNYYASNYVRTLAGSNVSVKLSDNVTITYESIVEGGITTFQTLSTGPELPANYKPLKDTPIYYDIETKANYSGKICIMISYDDLGMTENEENSLRLMQWDETLQQWIDITTSLDTENNVIFGETSHLSIFTIVIPLYVPPTTYTLTITTTAGGTTYPVPGTYTYTAGSSVQVTAIPDSGYIFDHWELNGTNVGSVNPYTIIIDNNYNLKAVFVLTPAPPTVTISPTLASILVGQSITFTSTVSGGYPPYSYQWYLNDNPVSGATSSTWTFTPTKSGIYYIYLRVTDEKGNTAQSNTARITVATVPVGGYSIPIQPPTTEKPTAIQIVLTTILTATFITIKRKTKRKH